MLEIISPITGERLQVAENDFEESMTWQQAMDACKYLGNGWRLPTKSELNVMYTELYQNGRGNFKKDVYWSCTEYGSNYAWYFYFDGGDATNASKDDTLYVRAVRAF